MNAALGPSGIEQRAARLAMVAHMHDGRAGLAGGGQQLADLGDGGIDAGQRQAAIGEVFVLMVDQQQGRLLPGDRDAGSAGHFQQGLRTRHKISPLRHRFRSGVFAQLVVFPVFITLLWRPVAGLSGAYFVLYRAYFCLFEAYAGLSEACLRVSELWFRLAFSDNA